MSRARWRDTGPTPTLRRRVVKGVRTFEKTGAVALLLTGGPAGRRPAEAEVMRDLARLAGTPEDRILIETQASTTFQNARRSADIMRRHGWTRAVVVTDAMHIPRALLAFRGVGIRAPDGVHGSPGASGRSVHHSTIWHTKSPVSPCTLRG